ncbi:MAG: hypothetical protein ACRDK5_01235 [Solirubrobacterales bacterium]
MASTTDDARLREYERSFRHAGLPLFSEDIDAAEDIFNRAAPLLGLVFLGEILGAGDLDWSWWQNLLAIAGGLAILLVATGLANRARGRAFSGIPQRLGKTELAGFVLLPSLLPLLFGGQLGSAALTAGANLLLLGLIYAVVGLGLTSIIRWVLARIVSQLRSALSLIARAVPLLAIFVLLSFPTQELWLIFSNPTRGIFATIIGMLALLGIAFLAVRLPREAGRLEREAGGDSPPLRRRQLFNVELVMFVSQATQVLLVSLMIGVFLTVFGVLAVDDEIRSQWLGDPGDELLGFELFGEHLELTTELLRVATGLAAFSGFYFSIAIFTDSTYRQEFLEEMTSEMRESFSERTEYLRLRKRTGAA